MASITDPLRDIFLAGVGALSIGAEKSKEVAGQLIERGKQQVEEGRGIVNNIDKQTQQKTAAIRDDIIAAHLKTLSPQERQEFVARVSDLADKVDSDASAPAADAQADGEVVIEVEAETVADANAEAGSEPAAAVAAAPTAQAGEGAATAAAGSADAPANA
jgi:polyhydroxyalkanoate synthesis regulator phasin